MKKIIIIIAMLILVSINAYAEEPTPEQILQKVADIGSTIIDMKANIIDKTTAKIDGKPDQITGPNNRIYYQKKPSKVKVENPVDNSFYIITADKMYLKEAGADLVETPNSESMNNQIDYINNLSKFLELNTVTTENQFVEGSIQYYALKVVPTTEPKPYSKIILTINYTQGIVSKMELYNLGDELVLTNEVQQYEIIDSIPIPVKTKETKLFADATVTTEVQYSNIILNQGIDDAIFTP